MKRWTDRETISHHVSICGQVLDTGGRPLPGIYLTIVPHGKQSESQPETRTGRARAKAASVQQEPVAVGNSLKRTESRPDGTFFFLDCPDGEYALTAVDTRSGVQVQQIVHSNADAMRKRMKERKPNEGYQVELVLKQ
jgi:hypothetical protein